MLSVLVKLGFMQKYKESYVLTRKGQKYYGESGDPYFWKVKSNGEGMTESEFLELLFKLTGEKNIFTIDDKGKSEN